MDRSWRAGQPGTVRMLCAVSVMGARPTCGRSLARMFLPPLLMAGRTALDGMRRVRLVRDDAQFSNVAGSASVFDDRDGAWRGRPPRESWRNGAIGTPVLSAL